MIKITREYICDLCGEGGAETYQTLAKFDTEQNEGRLVEPYITLTKIELCKNCIEKVVVISGRGAQGNNQFWLNENSDFLIKK